MRVDIEGHPFEWCNAGARRGRSAHPSNRATPTCAVVAALLLLGPSTTAVAQQATLAAATSAKSAADNAASKSFDLTLVDGKLVGASNTLRVKQGDAVQLHWISNVPMSLHLHGYDLAIPLQAEVPAVTSFAARLPGRFPVSDHGAGPAHERSVLYLEVLP